MKTFLILVAVSLGISATPDSKLELVCVKNSKAKNTCYYNFKVDGKQYQFMDIGCRYSRERVLQKVEQGTIALGKDWKVPC